MPPTPPAPAPTSPIAARRHVLRQTWTDPISGQELARAPTPLEWAVFGVRDVPAWLDFATSTLVASVGQLRRVQLASILDAIIAKDAKDTTGTFAAFRPETIPLPQIPAIERVIRETHAEVLAYGRLQVRAEASRQGVTPPLPSGDIEGALRAFALRLAPAAGASALQQAPQPDRSPRLATRGLTASAKITAEGMSDAWYRRILERALGIRKTGVEGDALRGAVYTDLFDQADAVRGEARAQVNEAFGLGRAVEAYALQDEIELVEYSALMDTQTCEACAALDGERFAWGSDRYYETFPPYQHCEGAKGRTNACRCVHLFLFKGRTV